MVRKKLLKSNYDALVKDLEEYGLTPAYRGDYLNQYNYLHYKPHLNTAYDVVEEREKTKRYRKALETAMDVLGARAGYELLAEDPDRFLDPLTLFIEDLERVAKTVEVDKKRAEAVEATRRVKGQS